MIGQVEQSKKADAASATEKLEWATPKVVRMRAGDAELGSNPTRPEGPIAVGS